MDIEKEEGIYLIYYKNIIATAPNKLAKKWDNVLTNALLDL